MSDVFKKLKLTDERTALIINAPSDFAASLQGLPHDSQFGKTTQHYDYVQFFVKSISEFENLIPQVITAGKYDCLIWACYPKGSGKVKFDINRDRIHDASPQFGVDTVTQISIDETWSAMRLRPLEAVGKKVATH